MFQRKKKIKDRCATKMENCIVYSKHIPQRVLSMLACSPIAQGVQEVALLSGLMVSSSQAIQNFMFSDLYDPAEQSTEMASVNFTYSSYKHPPARREPGIRNLQHFRDLSSENGTWRVNQKI